MKATRKVKHVDKYGRIPDILVDEVLEVDLKYSDKGLGVVICTDAESHVDHTNNIYFRMIIDLNTGYVLAKVAARDVPSIVKHIAGMNWCYTGVIEHTVEYWEDRKKKTKKVKAAHYTSNTFSAELNSYIKYNLSEN